MRRMILIPLLLVIAILAIAGGVGYYIYNNYMYYSTDDAQVTDTIVSVSATGNGQLSSLSVKQGDTVTAGQTIATITPVAGNTTLSITSPIDGTILQTPAVQGQTVVVGTPLVQVTNLKAVSITAYVDENQLNNISTGQQVDVTVDAYSGTTYTGHIQRIVQATAGSFSLLPTQDNTSGNFTKVGQRVPIVITLDGTAGKDLLPGMSAEAVIHLH